MLNEYFNVLVITFLLLPTIIRYGRFLERGGG